MTLDQNIIEMHDMLNVLMVDQRRILQLLTLIKKNVLENKLNLIDHGRITRHNDGLKITLPIPKNQHARHAPFYVGCTYGNYLPLHVRNLDLNLFKSEIKKMLFDGTLRPNNYVLECLRYRTFNPPVFYRYGYIFKYLYFGALDFTKSVSSSKT